MPIIKFITHDGTETEVEASSGSTVMQAALDNGIDAILAECGGACSCATCHCYIDDAWINKVGKPNDIEEAMLEGALEPKSNSRLSCQLVIKDDWDQLILHLPESQY